MTSSHAGLVAGGTILPSRFIKISTAADHTALQCGAGDVVFGISKTDTRNPPYSTLDDGNHAIAGEAVKCFGPGDICPLVAGAAVTRGSRLKSDASGRGIAVSANNDQFGAIALQSAAAAGDVIEVRIEPGVHGA